MAKQIPSLVVMVFLVLKFLDFIRTYENARQAMDERRAEALSRLGENCHGFQERLGDATRKVIERNSDALTKNTEALARIEVLIDDIDQRMTPRSKADGS